MEKTNFINMSLNFKTTTKIDEAADFVASAICGFIAIGFLIRLLKTRTYMPFVIYRLVLAAFILWQLGRFV